MINEVEITKSKSLAHSQYNNLSISTVGSNESKLDVHNKEMEINCPIFLCNRDLALSNKGKEENKEVLKYIKSISLICILEANNLLIEKVEYNENDSIEKTIWKVVEGLQEVRKMRSMEKQVQDFEKLKMVLKDSSPEITESYLNAFFCMATLSVIIKKYLEFLDDRIEFEANKFEHTSDRIVENIEPFLNEMIEQLELIKEKSYLSVFRIFLDTNLSCLSKCQQTEDFFGGSFANPELAYIYEALSHHGSHTMRNMACDFNKLQVLLDCMKKLKHVPTTYNNMALGYNVLKKSYDYYKSDIEGMNLAENEARQYCPLNPLKFYSNYRNLCSTLKSFAHKFYQMLQNTPKLTIKNEKVAQGATNSHQEEKTLSSNSNGRNTRRRKRKNPQNVNLKPQIASPQISPSTSNKIEKEENVVTIPSKQSLEKINIKTSSEKFVEKNIHEKSEKISPKEENKPLPLKKKTIEASAVKDSEDKKPFIIDLSKPNSDILTEDYKTENSSDESEFPVEPNFLMEIMLQFCEDRKKKQRNQEEKKQKQLLLKKAPQLLEENDGIDQKPKVEKLVLKLNKNQEETLQAVLLEKPPHYVISGKEIENLIEALGGTVQGASGSNFHICWKGLAKDGEYEMAHGGDNKGYLTSKWAKRVGKAIRLGVTNDKVNRSLSPYLVDI